MLKDLKEFLFKPEVIGFAIAVIFAGAIGAVITSIVEDIITPLIAMVVGQPDFASLNGQFFGWGNLMNAIINFLIVGTVLYFLGNAAKKAFPPAPDGPSDVDLLGEIRDLLKK